MICYLEKFHRKHKGRPDWVRTGAVGDSPGGAISVWPRNPLRKSPNLLLPRGPLLSLGATPTHLFHWNQGELGWFTIDTTSLSWPFLLAVNGCSLNLKVGDGVQAVWRRRWELRWLGANGWWGGNWVEITAAKMAVQWKRALIALGQHARGSSMLSPIRAT